MSMPSVDEIINQSVEALGPCPFGVRQSREEWERRQVHWLATRLSDALAERDQARAQFADLVEAAIHVSVSLEALDNPAIEELDRVLQRVQVQ